MDKAAVYSLLLLTPFFLTLLLTPLIGKLARRWGFIDYPRQPRHLHPSPVPRLGGVALFLSFIAAVGLSLFLVKRNDPLELRRLTGVILGSATILLLGIYDDKWELPALPQLFFQLVAASLAVFFGISIREVANPLGGSVQLPSWFAAAFTLFWLLGMMNTVNWLDGLDGLATGITFIAALVFFAHSNHLGQESIAILPLALAGCALGFLPYNFHPARVFLGTSGALFFGFALGTLSIIGGAKAATALLVLGVPILDVAWQIINRLRRGRSPFLADRGHLHHRLLDLGMSQRRVVLLYCGLSAASGGLALILPPGVYKLYALIVLGLVGAGIIFFATRGSTPKRTRER